MCINQENFSATYEKYKNTVYSVIFNYVRNVDDALDLMQNVFIKLLQYGQEFENEEHLKAWLIRVSCNEAKNLLKKNHHLSDEPIPEDIPYFAEHNENKDLMNYILDLPEKYRLPIHLFYYEGYSIRQIGDTLGIPDATVKIRLKRGKEKLAKVLVKEDWL